jgi:hypothetical protein
MLALVVIPEGMRAFTIGTCFVGFEPLVAPELCAVVGLGVAGQGTEASMELVKKQA